MKFRIVSLGVIFILIFVFSIGLNVFTHELGHYATADFFGFHPTLHLSQQEDSISGFFTVDSKLAYVQYSSNSPDVTTRDAIIAFAGPLVNLLIGLSALFVFLKTPEYRPIRKVALILFIVPSLIAFAVNVFPIAPSDGHYILQYILS